MPGLCRTRLKSSMKCGGKISLSTLPCLRAWRGVHHFHLRVPRFDAVFEINPSTPTLSTRRFLVEILQPLVLARLLLQRSVKPPVLNGDAEVSGERLNQFHVLAGEEIAGTVLPSPARRWCCSGLCRECSNSGSAARSLRAPSRFPGAPFACCRRKYAIRNVPDASLPRKLKSSGPRPKRWKCRKKTSPSQMDDGHCRWPKRSQCCSTPRRREAGRLPKPAYRPIPVLNSARGQTQSTCAGSRNACDKKICPARPGS